MLSALLSPILLAQSAPLHHASRDCPAPAFCCTSINACACPPCPPAARPRQRGRPLYAITADAMDAAAVAPPPPPPPMPPPLPRRSPARIRIRIRAVAPPLPPLPPSCPYSKRCGDSPDPARPNRCRPSGRARSTQRRRWRLNKSESSCSGVEPHNRIKFVGVACAGTSARLSRTSPSVSYDTFPLAAPELKMQAPACATPNRRLRRGAAWRRRELVQTKQARPWGTCASGSSVMAGRGGMLCCHYLSKPDHPYTAGYQVASSFI
jgi:hypothetical protein